MNVFRRSIIIDIDGTLYDNFARDDKKIISRLFENSILVELLDKFLWCINSLDLFSNSMYILNLRLKLYSFLSLSNYTGVKESYKIRYRMLLQLDLMSKTSVLKQLEKNYDIILVTNNLFAIKALYNNLNYEILYAPNAKSRHKQIKELCLTRSVAYVIGNNYTDDIVVSKENNIASVYVGKSIIKKFFKADNYVYSFSEILKTLGDSSF